LSFGNKKLQELESYIDRRKNQDFEDKIQITEKPQLKSGDFALGDKIMHKMWGKGTVVQLKEDIIVIAFENKGIKNLNLEYAPIEKI